mgnify:CR=1 FL=1
MQEYKLSMELTEPMLGTIPKNPDIYADWVKTQTNLKTDEEAPEETEAKSWTGFHSDENGLYIMDYMVKGFLKEAASILPHALEIHKKSGETLSGQTVKRRVENWVFVFPRRIYLGKKEPDGLIERPLRAMTMRGERITLVRSDQVNAGTKLEATLKVLDCPITEKTLRTWLDYGALKGLGQWRNASFGRFSYELAILPTSQS